MHGQHRIAVVVPAFCEERLVGKTLASIPTWVDSIHVVDDASPDGTSRAVTRVGDARVRLIRHAVNAGVGAAIATGYRDALESGADVLVVMAADGQMDPADLPALIGPIAEGHADYVKGNRFRHPEVRRMPRARRYAGKVLAAVTRRATGFPIDDSQCGYTALGRSAALALPLDELWPRYGYPNDLLGLLAQAGLRVVETPVRPIYADEESGIRTWHFGVVLWVIGRRWLAGHRGRPVPWATDQGAEVPLAR